jgi:hypothetical protein
MLQNKSITKHAKQSKNHMTESLLKNIGRCHKIQRADGTDPHRSICAAPAQCPEVHNNIRKQNQDYMPFLTNLEFCEEILGKSSQFCWQTSYDVRKAHINPDCFSFLSLPPHSPQHFNAQQCAVLNVPGTEPSGSGGVQRVPESNGEGEGSRSLPRAPLLTPMLPPPADDPFHSDWPHW